MKMGIFRAPQSRNKQKRKDIYGEEKKWVPSRDQLQGHTSL